MKFSYKELIMCRVLQLGLLAMLTCALSCEKYLEIDPPNHQLIGEVVFQDGSTVEAAFAHIYAEMRDYSPVSGDISGISYVMGLYADEYDHFSEYQQSARSFYDNAVLPSNTTVLSLWNSSYGLIYAVNRILEGVGSSTSLSQVEKDRFMGEAYFLRAFLHFHLVNLFGDVPYLDSTDYRVNQDVSRMDTESVYQRLVSDLTLANELMSTSADDALHFRPDPWVASALLARVYLYRGDWALALEESIGVIASSGRSLEAELGSVFKKGSAETLWQLDPGTQGYNTVEAYTLVILSSPPANIALAQPLLDSFEEGDQRLVDWVGSFSDGTDTWLFPNKYKLYNATAETEECSILFRLSELYLIAAESSAQLGELDQALGYLNAVRARASLPLLPDMGQEEVLDAIYHERRIELFSELGHRFMDLKRSGRADLEQGISKPGWDATDIVLPIPEQELIKNPNLLPQNDGF
ncbi:RagB/SusD family nutrient uptake outer membrane protein [Muricauda sp. CAU 1633]|uniref:RagB/SusD family nutrient uptake outer membrane protein n=1 Tax=Allomuricauda sp. CAU 1633 TaxID=2816036 RepID=UPI001A8DB539|nr:RagB/SusD family nutrient uptake outer membrane protein [Muricauda sp. CAU 1633]MBO0322164.1 RagB/SusD family nutrient uptake outer membrane protein [Muricauda sp. CAU 1633]